MDVKKRTGYQNRQEPTDRLTPTRWSIERGNFVVPRRFVEGGHTIDWQDFSVEIGGREYSHKKLDRQRRLGIPLAEICEVGDELQLSVRNEKLVIEIVNKGPI